MIATDRHLGRFSTGLPSSILLPTKFIQRAACGKVPARIPNLPTGGAI